MGGGYDEALKSTFDQAQSRRIQQGQLPQIQKIDYVNRPPHYTKGKIEVIDFIDDQRLDFYDAQVIKYVCRAKHKGSELQDLEKAAWYLKRKIEKLKNESTVP